MNESRTADDCGGGTDPDRAFETLVAELSTKFINLPAQQVDTVIQAAQREVCEELDLDISTLWQWSADSPQILELTHFHRRFDGPPVPTRMSGNEFFPWSTRQVAEGRSVLLHSISELPPEAVRDREMLLHFGIKSAVFLPLSAGGSPSFGALCFENVEREHAWPPLVVNRLRLVGQIFANALTRRSHEMLLLENEGRLNLAADAAGAGLWSLKLSSGLYWVTPPVRRVFGFDSTEVVTQKKVLARVHPEDRASIQAAIASVVRSAEQGRVEYRVVRPDLSVRWVVSQGRVHYNSSGEAERLTGVTIDVSEQKLAQLEVAELREQLAHFGRVALASELAGSVVNELSQPLSASLPNLHVALEMLRRPEPDLSLVTPVLEDALAANRRAVNIIERLRGWMKRDGGQFREHELNELVEETLRFLQSEFELRGLRCSLDLCLDHTRVMCDRLAMEQVITSLLRNAWESLEEQAGGGQVTVRTFLSESRLIELVVEDNGGGIAAEVMPKLFQPFVTCKRDGLGLSLSLCRTIVENYRGRIRAENRPEGGARFAVTLPRAPEA